MHFSGSLIFPVASLLERPVECHSPGAGTVIDATAAVPAFFRMQDNRRLPLLGVGYVNIDLTDLDAVIAAITDLRVKNHRTIWCAHIRQSDYFFLRHFSLQNQTN
jgi:hypothetical protein